MTFSKNDTFVARRTFTTFDTNDFLILINKGDTFKTGEDRRLVDIVTGNVHDITNHVSSRWDWYFDKRGSFNPFQGTVTRAQYVSEILRHADGFDLEELFSIAEDENFGPLDKPISRAAFSQCLTDAVATGRFEMRKDGELVIGVGHNARNCTFHVVRKKVA